MLNHSIAGLSALMGFVSILWLISSLLLIGIILIQKGKGGGLGGAFGGAGGGGGLLGTKTGDFLTWVTITLVFLFFFLAIILVKFGKDTTYDGLRATPVTGTETTIPTVPETDVDTIVEETKTAAEKTVDEAAGETTEE
jgi:preprotein translocase subunit SecG